MFAISLLSLVVLSYVKCSMAAPENELIGGALPLAFRLNFKQYSGYLTGASSTQQLFYWFVESQQDSAKDPLVLWFTGGPGCSSLVALLTESGPYRVDAHTNRLTENIYAWNKVANVLFLESPVETGFSYSSVANFSANDDTTAEENYHALLNFLEKFPEYKRRDVFVTGESYAGVYVPMLAVKLLKDKTNFPNFKGVVLGNNFVSAKFYVNANVHYLYNHGFISELLWVKLRKCCNGSTDQCDFYEMYQQPGTHCNEAIAEAISKPLARGINPYDYTLSCYPAERSASKGQPCTGVPTPVTWGNEDILEPFLNSRRVKDAIHVSKEFGDRSWRTCSREWAIANYAKQNSDMSSYYKTILDSGIRILLHYGDADATTTILSGQWFVKGLGRPLIRDTEPWYFEGATPPLAGFATYYDRIDFLTVKGAGHFVPESKPAEALQMLVNFIRNTGNYSIPIDLNVSAQPLLNSATILSTLGLSLPAFVAVVCVYVYKV